MSQRISAAQLGDYLNFLSREIQKALPVPLGKPAHYAGLSPDQIAARLCDLYDAISLSRQAGWGLERRFLKGDGLPVQLVEESPALPATAYPASAYKSVHHGLGRANYKAYLHWLGEQTGKALDNFVTPEWALHSDSGIRQALLRLYEQSGLNPDGVCKAEKTFIERFHQKAAKPTLFEQTSPQPEQARLAVDKPSDDGESNEVFVEAEEETVHPEPPSVRSNMAMRDPERPARRKAATRRNLRKTIGLSVSIAMLCAVLIWVWTKYRAYEALPHVYALADNIAVHKEPSDGSEITGRLDLFGESPDGQGGMRPSRTQFKAASEELDNGYYPVMAEEGFAAWLLHGKGAWYVHQHYVTTGSAEYERQKAMLINLRGDANELDKLSFAVRQSITQGAAQKSFVPAASCAPQKLLSKTAPLSVFKYANQETGELIVIVQATDGRCYHLQGMRDGAPTEVTTLLAGDGTPFPAGGLFSLKGATCIFRRCDNGERYFSKYPFSQFQILDSAPVPQSPASASQ